LLRTIALFIESQGRSAEEPQLLWTPRFLGMDAFAMRKGHRSVSMERSASSRPAVHLCFPKAPIVVDHVPVLAQVMKGFKNVLSRGAQKNEGTPLLSGKPHLFLKAREDLTKEQGQERARLGERLPLLEMAWQRKEGLRYGSATAPVATAAMEWDPTLPGSIRSTSVSACCNANTCSPISFRAPMLSKPLSVNTLRIPAKRPGPSNGPTRLRSSSRNPEDIYDRLYSGFLPCWQTRKFAHPGEVLPSSPTLYFLDEIFFYSCTEKSPYFKKELFTSKGCLIGVLY
jgi:hypothetical protein